jgi:hypothetical protein
MVRIVNGPFCAVSLTSMRLLSSSVLILEYCHMLHMNSTIPKIVILTLATKLCKVPENYSLELFC